MNRQDANKLIMGQLAEAITRYPDLRFFQLLHMLNIVESEFIDTPDGVFKNGIIDNFYEESTATLDKVLKVKQGL